MRGTASERRAFERFEAVEDTSPDSRSLGDGGAMGAELQGLRSITNDRSVVNHGPGQLLLSNSFMIMVCNKHDVPGVKSMSK